MITRLSILVLITMASCNNDNEMSAKTACEERVKILCNKGNECVSQTDVEECIKAASDQCKNEEYICDEEKNLVEQCLFELEEMTCEQFEQYINEQFKPESCEPCN